MLGTADNVTDLRDRGRESRVCREEWRAADGIVVSVGMELVGQQRDR